MYNHAYFNILYYFTFVKRIIFFGEVSGLTQQGHQPKKMFFENFVYFYKIIQRDVVWCYVLDVILAKMCNFSVGGSLKKFGQYDTTFMVFCYYKAPSIIHNVQRREIIHILTPRYKFTAFDRKCFSWRVHTFPKCCMPCIGPPATYICIYI